MGAVISKESQDAYAMFQSCRIKEFDYKNADHALFMEMTHNNTKAIQECAGKRWGYVPRIEKNADGVRVLEYQIDGAEAGKYIYYIHGGGFVQGEPEWGDFCAVAIAKMSHRNLISVDYRLAPDIPFPAAPDDCIRAYQWMLSQGILPENIVFLGESSGGNLVLAAAVGLKQRGIPMPAAIAAVSPVVNLKFDFPAYQERIERECIIPYNQDHFAQDLYMGGVDLENPLASPYFGDCHGFPPVFLGVSTEESLFDDSIRMHEKLLKEDVDSTLVVWENMWHTFYMMDFPESQLVFEQISAFYQRF